MSDVPVTRSPEVLHEIVDGRAVLVDPNGMELLTLNAVGTLVWEALREPRDAGALADAVLPHVVGVERDALEQDISEFVAELRDLGLVIEEG